MAGPGMGSVRGVSKTRSMLAGAAPPQSVCLQARLRFSQGDPSCLRATGVLPRLAAQPTPLPTSFQAPRTSFRGQGRGLEGGPRAWKGKLPTG